MNSLSITQMYFNSLKTLWSGLRSQVAQMNVNMAEEEEEVGRRGEGMEKGGELCMWIWGRGGGGGSAAE